MPHQAAKKLIDEEIRRAELQRSLSPLSGEVSQARIAGLRKAKELLDQSYKKPKGKRSKLI